MLTAWRCGTGEGGLLTVLVKQVLQAGLEVEMEEHLGMPARPGRPRVGEQPQPLLSQDGVDGIGQVELAVPRDRAGTFEPVTVPKYQRHFDGLAVNVISLYA